MKLSVNKSGQGLTLIYREGEDRGERDPPSLASLQFRLRPPRARSRVPTFFFESSRE